MTSLRLISIFEIASISYLGYTPILRSTHQRSCFFPGIFSMRITYYNYI